MQDPFRFLEEFEGKANRLQEQLEQSQAALAESSSEVSSSDGAVTVTVAGGGSIRSLDLTPKAMELGRTKLASTIMETIHKAQAQAARDVQESMRPLLGEGEAMSFLTEQVEAGIARMQPDEDPQGDQPRSAAGRAGNDVKQEDNLDDWDWEQQRKRGGRA